MMVNHIYSVFKSKVGDARSKTSPTSLAYGPDHDVGRRRIGLNLKMVLPPLVPEARGTVDFQPGGPIVPFAAVRLHWVREDETSRLHYFLPGRLISREQLSLRMGPVRPLCAST
jgi:hypothetical protein